MAVDARALARHLKGRAPSRLQAEADPAIVPLGHHDRRAKQHIAELDPAWIVTARLEQAEHYIEEDNAGQDVLAMDTVVPDDQIVVPNV